MRFELEPADIKEALAAPSMQVCMPPCFSKYLLAHLQTQSNLQISHRGSDVVGKRRKSLCTAKLHWCSMQACMCASVAWLTVQVDAPEDVDVPKHLLAPEEVEQLVAEHQPCFVPLERYGPGADPTPPADSATGGPENASLPYCYAVLSSLETFLLVFLL